MGQLYKTQILYKSKTHNPLLHMLYLHDMVFLWALFARSGQAALLS